MYVMEYDRPARPEKAFTRLLQADNVINLVSNVRHASTIRLLHMHMIHDFVLSNSLPPPNDQRKGLKACRTHTMHEGFSLMHMRS